MTPGVTRVLLVAEEEARILQPLIDRSGDMAVTGVVRSSAWAINAARGTVPDVVMICLEPRAGLEVAHRLVGELGPIPMLAMSSATEVEYPTEAALVGASYLERPFTDEELLSTLRLVAASPAGVPVEVASEADPPPVEVQPIAEDPAPAAAQAQPASTASGTPTALTPGEPIPGGRVTVVLGAKGGVGKTTVAIALAHALDGASPGRVGIVDMDLQFGDVALMLGVNPLRGMSDISREIARRNGTITAAAVESMMPDYHGICLVCGPSSPDYSSVTSANDVAILIGALRPTFDHIVIDASTHLTDPLLRAIDLADRILLVTDLSLGSLHGAQLCLEVLRKCALPMEAIGVVVNRVAEEEAGALDGLDERLGAPIEMVLPRRDEQATAATQKRAPINAADAQSLLSQGITQLANSIQTAPPRLAVRTTA